MIPHFAHSNTSLTHFNHSASLKTFSYQPNNCKCSIFFNTLLLLDEKLKIKFTIKGLKLGKSWLATLTSIQPKEEKRKTKGEWGRRKGANVVQFKPN